MEGHTARLETVQAERGALDGQEIEDETVAGMLANDFQAVWQSLASGERRRLVGAIVERVDLDADASTPVIRLARSDAIGL